MVLLSLWFTSTVLLSHRNFQMLRCCKIVRQVACRVCRTFVACCFCCTFVLFVDSTCLRLRARCISSLEYLGRICAGFLKDLCATQAARNGDAENWLLEVRVCYTLQMFRLHARPCVMSGHRPHKNRETVASRLQRLGPC